MDILGIEGTCLLEVICLDKIVEEVFVACGQTASDVT